MTLASLQPFKDFILVKPDAPETMRGGLHLVRDRVEDPTAGIVVKLGPQAAGVKVGDRVRFFAGKEITLDGELYLLLKAINPETPDAQHTRYGIYGVVA